MNSLEVEQEGRERRQNRGCPYPLLLLLLLHVLRKKKKHNQHFNARYFVAKRPCQCGGRVQPDCYTVYDVWRCTFKDVFG